MESLRAIEFGVTGPRPKRTELRASEVRRGTGRQPGPAVLFVATSDLTDLKQSLPADALIDRGAKHPARPLADYFRGRTGPLAISTGYSNAGQAERGARSLLMALGPQAHRTTVLVGVSDLLFEQLWRRAEPGHDENAEGQTAPESSSNLKFLLEQTALEQVPSELRSRFRGHSPAAELVRRLIARAARSDCPVLIQGETGTGKEVVARQIHHHGPRGAEAFEAVNCGGIPSELLESELFGHVKGAFTGAIRDKAGLWTRARHGTLFLDEIGDLSLQHQVKILRAIEDGRYQAVGGDKEILSRARIIAATHCDLAHMVQAGLFREDLYYRLFQFRIRTPALREHIDDLPEIADHFWRDITRSRYQPLPVGVIEVLKAYRWPGNARELRAFLTNVFLLTDARGITVPLVESVMRERLGPLSAAYRDP